MWGGGGRRLNYDNDDDGEGNDDVDDDFVDGGGGNNDDNDVDKFPCFKFDRYLLGSSGFMCVNDERRLRQLQLDSYSSSQGVDNVDVRLSSITIVVVNLRRPEYWNLIHSGLPVNVLPTTVSPLLEHGTVYAYINSTEI